MLYSRMQAEQAVDMHTVAQLKTGACAVCWVQMYAIYTVRYSRCLPSLLVLLHGFPLVMLGT
jgi:hypothetical protein